MLEVDPKLAIMNYYHVTNYYGLLLDSLLAHDTESHSRGQGIILYLLDCSIYVIGDVLHHFRFHPQLRLAFHPWDSPWHPPIS